MYILMYDYIYVLLYVCMYVLMYDYIYVLLYVCMYVLMYDYIYVLLYVCMYVLFDPVGKPAISRSSQCSTTGVTKALVCAILSVGWCI